MRKRIVFAASVMMLASVLVFGQPQQQSAVSEPEYTFTVIKENPITSIKNQSRSSTCWSFSTLAYLESEAIRIKGLKDPADYPDFSEMFVVGQSYKERAVKYIRTDGHISFSPGSESGDVLHVIEDWGLVPQSAMPGLQPLPVHGELDATTKAYVDAILRNPNRTLSDNWKKGFDAIVDTYLGEPPVSFEVNGKTYTPAEYRDEMGIVPSDYVAITSFTHHPFYSSFVIELGDNWRWDPSYNVPLDEFMQILYDAVENGYTVAWGTDVSETGFTRNGIGVLLDESANSTAGSDQARWVGAEDAAKQAARKELPREKVVTQESRQKEFDNKLTTDDHGMQIFGLATDQNGTKYFMVKNSWGETGKYKGIWYCSDAFVRAKSVEFTVHKDALSKDLKKKLGIK
ncbi:MAG: aminopeptidase [Bacteroidales bacterium]|jgi:aminopeptidase C|nr:C1 family peptidase [Bacteroidota bacterium]NLN99402.1 aminopeptidase [Bacteroidales bacterium]